MHENIKKKRGHWESFDDMDRLGHNCRCLLEDKEGNIWGGSDDGLSRYDGTRFLNFSQKDGLAGNRVYCLYRDREGHIWIGTESGLSRFDGSGFVNFTQKDGLIGDNIVCVYQDREGDIWVGTGNYRGDWGCGLNRYDGVRFVNFTQKDGLVGDNTVCVYQDREGNLWIGSGNWIGDWGCGLSRYDGKEFLNFIKKDGLPSNHITCMHQDKAGNLWIGTGNGLCRYDGKEFVNFTEEKSLAGNYITCICQDREGNIWVGIWEVGVVCYDGKEFIKITDKDGLAANYVSDIIQDREGSLWFACCQGGISRYNPYEISTLSDEPVNEVMIQDKSGNLWWGSWNTLSRFDGKDVTHYSFEKAIHDIFEDSKGRLWIATQGEGVFICDNIKDSSRIGQGKPCPYITRNLTVADGLANNYTWMVGEDTKGNIWIGTWNGLSRYDGLNFTNFTTDDGLGSNNVTVIFQDRNGLLYFGGWSGGGISLYRFDKTQRKDGKSFHRYTIDAELIDDELVGMMCMTEDSQGNLWIGANGVRIINRDGKSFRRYTTGDGLLSNAGRRILQDRRGQVWIATLGGGVNRFDGKNFQALTTADGLSSNRVTGIIEDSDGSFIISTYKGICRYIPDYKAPPLIKIDEVDADKIYQKPKDIQISKSVSTIRIKYHGMSFKTKRMRYNYILEGYDKEWKATWDEEVRYENLPVGEYTFKVIAISRDLVYSESPAEVKLAVQPDPRDAELAALRRELDNLRGEVGRKYHFDNIVGRSAPMKQVYVLMEKAIDSGLTVLISGETGVGKELVAKAIHYNSPRKNKPLLDLDCGAVPRDLVASILFGHRKGAFTGAYEDSIGILETASGGTVILDEISTMPNEAQVHLLRALQERKIRRVGETRLRDIDVRIITITNRDLKAELKAGRFREDLYYRLNVFPIQVPPLRERLEDTPLLAEHFLQKACRQLRKKIDGFADGVFEMLASYDWPGNVRELENEINRAVALVEEGQKIQIYHFSSNVVGDEALIRDMLSEPLSYTEMVARLRKRLIENTLRECGGNKSQAAKKLGIHRSNLIRQMRKLGIEDI